MRHEEHELKGQDGLRLYTRSWLPDTDPKALVAVVHGLAEHSGRYAGFAGYLVPAGYAVAAFDLRGHGRSEGRRGYVDRFEEYLDDVAIFLEMLRRSYPGLPAFLLGHSLGGTIVAAYAGTRKLEDISGLIFSGPGIKVGTSISAVQVFFAHLLSRLAPGMGVATLDADAISRDRAVVQAYVSDPLVFRGRISARLGSESLRALSLVQQNMHRISCPVLILHGGDDRLSNPEGSQLLYDGVSSADRTLVVYSGYYHELFNEPGRETVLANLVRWLDEHLPAAAPG